MSIDYPSVISWYIQWQWHRVHFATSNDKLRFVRFRFVSFYCYCRRNERKKLNSIRPTYSIIWQLMMNCVGFWLIELLSRQSESVVRATHTQSDLSQTNMTLSMCQWLTFRLCFVLLVMQWTTVFWSYDDRMISSKMSQMWINRRVTWWMRRQLIVEA